MGSRNQFDQIKGILEESKLDLPRIKQAIEQLIENYYKKTGPENISREEVRGLRIQNKKLMEQIASLRKQLVESKEDRNRIKAELSCLEKLNNALSNALGLAVNARLDLLARKKDGNEQKD